MNGDTTPIWMLWIFVGLAIGLMITVAIIHDHHIRRNHKKVNDLMAEGAARYEQEKE